MEKQDKARSLAEAAMIIGIASLFTIIGNYIPFLTILLFLLPVPFMILGKRHGLYVEILSIGITGAIVGGFIGIWSSVILFSLTSIVAITMGYMMDKKYDPMKIWAGGIIAFVTSIVLVMGLVTFAMGNNVVQELMNALNESKDMAISLYSGMGIEPGKLEQMETAYEAFIVVFGMTFPSILILISVVFSYVNYLLTAYILNKIGDKTPIFPQFKYFKLPDSIVMGTVIILLLTYLTQYIRVVDFNTLSANVSLLFRTAFFIQGLAVISFLIEKYRLGRLYRIFVFVYVLFSGPGGLMTVILGLIDVFADFRKLKKLG
ncbi:uncharacterized protein YybS (DUF2232 family) [Anaerosolibacter carboniphilus]|uniref:Uncharacterized protein YybS (DUF2232 family) n=1 Tax=Anaerosolibacter carboniphilus TaxID=1417629 RepID=A0A841L3I3_9FIRM|nr:YybS family protein [Anaerosolibacter carboniphilus]MBB6218730.1 uncharacterized protein YybS (DUF2232 family) [Anaerosolibacter carboniphilus]